MEGGNLAGMSKNQLYHIMSQMKTLIEQNQQQARQILIQNPLLTRALFQAQIMLGMVHPPQTLPNIQPIVSPSSTKPMQPTQQTNIQVPSRPLPNQSDSHDQTSASQIPVPMRKQHQLPPMVPPASTSAPPMNLPPPPLPLHALQSAQNLKNTANAQVSHLSLPPSSQVHNMTHPIQPPMPVSSSQLQQSLPTSGMPRMLMQPPLPPQPRPPSMPNFPHHPQMGPNAGLQHPGATQPHHAQTLPMFHSGMRPHGMGPSFPQGQPPQPPRPSQPPPHPMYQGGGPHLNTDFGNQAGNTMQPERGGSWMPGLPDNNMTAAQPSPPLSLGPSSQLGQSSQPSRPPAPLTPEMEQALLQQVMGLTQEQINLLPPEQRNQVLQLQQMLRQS